MFGISFTNLSSQTNVYHPMLSDTTVEWITSDGNTTLIYQICGSLKIKGKTYKVICRTNCIPTGSTTCSFLYKDTIAYMREDTIIKKIWGYSWSYYNNTYPIDTSGNEVLLYDFDSIYVGKPLYSYYHQFSNIPDTIKCADSTQLLDGTWRKYFTSEPPFISPGQGNSCGTPSSNAFASSPGTVVEGIGNIIMPFDYWIVSNNPNAYRNTLFCFKKNNIPLWTIFSPTSTPCNITVIVEKNPNIVSTNKQYLIYPTITDNYLTIQSCTGMKNTLFELFDVFGNLIYQMYADDNTSKYVLYLDKFQNGIYLLKISNNKDCFWNRIIINH